MVVTEPPLSAVVPPAFVVTEVSAVAPPSAPPKVVMPAVLAVRLNAPSTVPANDRLPAPVLVSVVFAPSMTASL